VKSCKKIFGICENHSKMISSEGNEEINSIGEIQFKNVGFSYTEGVEVFSDLNLKIEKNKFNAFCG
jgi:ABC-type multidrug transport system fused ATPase/permease subunit